MMGDQDDNNNMAGRGGAATLISSFKKFLYGTKHEALWREGYRLATVYETEQLLKAIRDTEGGGKKKQKAEQWNVVEHELVPGGEEEAYRLQDGYLLDFGTLRTFYPDTHDKFSITYKLCILLSHSDLNDTRSIKLWLPLALLHACAEEDLCEITWLVSKSKCIQGNIANMNLVSTTVKDDLLVQMQDPLSTGTLQESTQGMTSTSTHNEGLQNRGLELLLSGTPWLINGGTTLHFCALAQKAGVTRHLLSMNLINSRLHLIKSRLLSCEDNESTHVSSSWLAAVRRDQSTIESKITSIFWDIPFWDSDLGVDVFGNSWALRAAKEGNWEVLADFAFQVSSSNHERPKMKSVRETHPHLFNQLDGNSFLHYLVLRPDFVRKHLDELERQMDILAEFAFEMENYRAATAFQVALSRGRSEVCEWLLKSYRGSPPEFASRALALRDCEDRNMLHLYAEGGASKEVGSMILRRLKAAEEEPIDLSLPLFLRRAKDAGKIKELINELNTHGDTPCTVALRKGHSDALQMLMPLWGEELAMRYRHPSTLNNILHCYARSTHPGAIAFEWSSFFSAPSSLQTLLSATNSNGYTPLMSALYESSQEINADSAAFAWLLRQGGGGDKLRYLYPNPHVDMHANILFEYARKFDNEELARELIRGFLQELAGTDVHLIEIVPMEAVEHGNPRTFDAILAELSGRANKTPDYIALLHALLRGIQNGGIRDPQGMWKKLESYVCKEDGPNLKDHVSANASIYADALVSALEAGNVKACEWLLDYIRAKAGVDALRRFIINHADFVDKAFDKFAEGNCKGQSLWDNLKESLDWTSENVQSPSTSSAASWPIAHEYDSKFQSLRNQRVDTDGSLSGVDCALCFLKYPGLASSTLGWMSRTSLKSFKVLAHMKRHKYYSYIFHRPDILQLAAEFQSFELFDMALQVQTHEQIENHSHNIDKLIATIISRIPLGSSNCFLQVLSMRFAEERGSPLIISWKRLCDDKKGLDFNLGPTAWLWACIRHSQASSSLIVGNESVDTGGSAVDVERRDQQQHEASRPEDQSTTVAVEQRENVSQVPGFTEALQAVYLHFTRYYWDWDENFEKDVLALGYNIVKQGPNPVSSHAIQLLRKMSSKGPHPVVLAQMLFLMSQDTANEADPGFDALFPELLDAFIMEQEAFIMEREAEYRSILRGKQLQTLLYHAIAHQKSISFLKFKMFLASSASLPTTLAPQHKTTLLHNLLSSKSSDLFRLISVFHCFRFFQVEDVRDHTGATALHVACREQKQECARVLLAMHPQLARLGRRTGKTALHDSALSGHLEIVQEILRFRRETNALLDERDADGKTALHFAAASGSENSIRVVELLLAHAKENGNYAPLLLWASAGSAIGTAYKVAKDPRVILLLQREMASVSQNVGNLLELAISKGSDIMKRELINRGAQIEPKFLGGIQKMLDTTRESDQPARTDSLGRGPLAKGIAALLLNPFTAVPITVGIFGPWGMGKSSVMLQTEIAMMMTMIENNLLPLEPSIEDDFPGCRAQREDMTWKGKEVCHQLQTALQQHQSSASHQHISMLSRSKPLISTVSIHIKLLFTKLQKKLFSWSCWTKNIAKQEEDNIKILQDFVSHYNEKLKPLYKGLSLMDRQDLFGCHNILEKKSVVKIPSCITIIYNAWLYFGEKEASSGLAFTMMKELEECLNTAQWLRLCCRYAYKSDPIFFFSNITLPLIVWLAIGSWVLYIMWELLSLPSIANNQALNNFRYGSLPIAMVISTWVILRNILNVVKPVSEQVFKSLHTKNLYEAKLGYHQQIIDDIEFFKEELCEVPSFGWKFCGKIWSIFVKNKDNIPSTNIKKTLISKKDLRIIVFVDDVDRCTDRTYILQLLGAINLILSVCSINVIIGMDKDMVEQVLKSAYQDNVESAQKFLEKIIQLPVYLNEANEQEMTNFVKEHLLGGHRSARDDSTSLKRGHDFYTTNTGSPFTITSNANYSNAEDIAIITENHIHSQGITNGQRNNTITSVDNLSSASTPDGISHETESSNVGEALQHVQDVDKLEGDDSLAIKSHLLVPNYTRTELETFSYLQSRAKVEHRQPRNWKRFQNYHRLAWYIISQTKSRILRFFDGWQMQLIVWVFICYNWEHEMNEIFKNWKELIEEISREGTNDATTVHELISFHMKKKDKADPSMKEWEQLADTVSSLYDIEIKVGIFFQNYRFYCVTNPLAWEN